MQQGKDADNVLEKTNRDVKALRLAQRALQINEYSQVNAIAFAVAANQAALPTRLPLSRRYWRRWPMHQGHAESSGGMRKR